MGMTRKGVESRIRKYITSFLKTKNFHSNEESESYHNCNGGIETIIGIGINTVFDIKGDFIINYGFGIRFIEIEESWEQYRNILEETNRGRSDTLGFGRSTINPNSVKYPEHRFAKGGGAFIKNEEDIYTFLDEFKIEFEELLLPFVKEVSKLSWLDEKLNSNPLAFQEICPPFSLDGLEFRKIIVAKLNSNPNFDNIYHEIRKDTETLAKTDDYMKKVLLVLDRVYEDIKDL